MFCMKQGCGYVKQGCGYETGFRVVDSVFGLSVRQRDQGIFKYPKPPGLSYSKNGASEGCISHWSSC